MKKVILSLLCMSVTAGALRAQTASAALSTKPGTTAPQAPSLPIKPAVEVPPVSPAPPVAPAPGSKPTNPNIGVFKFEEETHDYGTVVEGPLAECDFVFRNTGKEPIVINGAHGSCGCTVPTWPHEPILPGQKATIHVAYTTNGRQGYINKDVIISSNAYQDPMRLHITGTVIPKPVPAAPPTIDSK
ncbi:MAG: hypothetical protein JWQ38_3788 [Flavipsychrobacter sp.]|nr:hypothetical protein [Flavipsychrobacter sp.]